ncbi:MAG: hypothetical protein IPK17_38510 [Chloroflexi bacterium]|uniref:hypothetical protein n=1 Tax=Candidatus Flexifilum breve TaxID=3140694 RepID=UPI0031366FED|nr:hypothetical protein [Chloroflexota bacterium]
MAQETFERIEHEGGVTLRARSGAGTIDVTRNGIGFNLRNLDGSEYVAMPEVLKEALEAHAALKNPPEAKVGRPPKEPKAEA